MKKLLSVVLAGIMVFSMAACGNGGTDAVNEDMINVSIEIDYPDNVGVEDVAAELIVDEGTNAMDMLYQYAEENDVEVVLDESSATVYVTSIGGVEQTADAGWIYEVNDEMTMDAADELILEEGMKISWEYMSWSEFSE